MRRLRVALPAVPALPRASTATSTPWGTTARIISTASPVPASKVISAPACTARASAWPLTSIPMTRAPRERAIITAARPTPPQPKTATDSAALTPATSTMPRYDVANRQPRLAATSNGRPSGSATTLKSAHAIAANSAYDPGPWKPGCHWFGQTCALPDTHHGHPPHPQMNGTTTRSPTCTRATPSPTACTTPANSCPGVWGRDGISGSWPCQPCQSDRHKPAASTGMTAPPAAAAGIGTSATYGIPPKASNRTARIHDVPSGASAAAYQPPVEPARAASPPAQGGPLRSAGPPDVMSAIALSANKCGSGHGGARPPARHQTRAAPHSEHTFPRLVPVPAHRTSAHPQSLRPASPLTPGQDRPGDLAATATPFPGNIGPYPECPDMDGPYFDRQRTGICAERRLLLVVA